jgi:hypothetical protein
VIQEREWEWERCHCRVCGWIRKYGVKNTLAFLDGGYRGKQMPVETVAGTPTSGYVLMWQSEEGKLFMFEGRRYTFNSETEARTEAERIAREERRGQRIYVAQLCSQSRSEEVTTVRLR